MRSINKNAASPKQGASSSPKQPVLAIWRKLNEEQSIKEEQEAVLESGASDAANDECAVD